MTQHRVQEKKRNEKEQTTKNHTSEQRLTIQEKGPSLSLHLDSKYTSKQAEERRRRRRGDDLVHLQPDRIEKWII